MDKYYNSNVYRIYQFVCTIEDVYLYFCTSN